MLVDVGCGDGLIGLAALDRVGDDGRVVFVDVSERLLKVCKREAVARGFVSRALFIQVSADHLDGIDDASADAVTTRSVLIYIADKARAFEAFRRILRVGGRLSIWEPINVHGVPERRGYLNGYDLSPVAELADRVRAVYLEAQPPDYDPMLGFDERDMRAGPRPPASNSSGCAWTSRTAGRHRSETGTSSLTPRRIRARPPGGRRPQRH